AIPPRPVREKPSGAHAPPVDLEQQLPRRAHRGGFALRAVPETISRLLAAVDDGKQRQIRDSRREESGLPDGADLLGRTRHQWPALVLPVDPSGHPAYPVRLYNVRSPAHAPGLSP